MLVSFSVHVFWCGGPWSFLFLCSQWRLKLPISHFARVDSTASPNYLLEIQHASSNAADIPTCRFCPSSQGLPMNTAAHLVFRLFSPPIHRRCRTWNSRASRPNREWACKARSLFNILAFWLSPLPCCYCDIQLKVIGQYRAPFAVQSGGHTSNPGFSSTRGVHITLSRFNQWVHSCCPLFRQEADIHVSW